MTATKANKVYTIDEAQKAQYAKEGFDIVDDNGKTIKHAVGKTVSYEQYAETLTEVETLKAEFEKCSSLKGENEELKKQLADVTAELAKLKKADK